MKKELHARFQGIRLLLVQCSVCVFALVIVLLMRVVSGASFTRLASEFQSAMVNERMVYADAYFTEIHTEEKARSDRQPNENVVAPLQKGIITSGFGDRIDPLDGTKVSFHKGVDIAAEENSPLYAMMSGRVVYVRNEPSGYGQYLAVSYKEGCRYVFAHCSSIAVQPGQTVEKGDVIAYVGNSGRSTGHHVHVEWIVDEKAIDPMTVLPESAYV